MTTKTTPYHTPPGDVDGFLVTLLDCIRMHDGRIAYHENRREPINNFNYTLDITDLVLDLIGVPEEKLVTDPKTGEAVMKDGAYCRDWLRSMVYEANGREDLQKFVVAARAEAMATLTSKFRDILGTWDAWRADDSQMIPPVELFKQMDGIRTAIATK